MKSHYIVLFFIIFSFSENLHSQKGDSVKIKELSVIVSNKKISSDERVKSIFELLNMYSKSENEKIDTYIEGNLIKFTNFSHELFFHEFELKLPLYLNKSQINEKKLSRLYLIICNKVGDNIDYKYYNLAKREINTITEQQIKPLSCDSTSYVKGDFIQSKFKENHINQFNDYYLSIIYSCPDNKKYIDKLKKYYFLLN